MNSSFHRPLRLELIYQAEIKRLTDKYFKLLNVDSFVELQKALLELAALPNFIQDNAKRLATNMVTMVANGNFRSWRQAAASASKGRLIYSMLQKELQGPLKSRLHSLIQENSHYISTLPQNLATRTVLYVQREQLKGRRSEDIMKDLKPYMQNLRDYQIQRLARTEVAKADTAITRVRAESIGLNWYEWQTSQDARVRVSHRKMNQVLVNWTDPPSPEQLVKEKSEGHYHAGNIYNCRCVALPVLSLNSLTWPRRIYHSGALRLVSQRQFLEISGIPKQLVA